MFSKIHIDHNLKCGARTDASQSPVSKSAGINIYIVKSDMAAGYPVTSAEDVLTGSTSAQNSLVVLTPVENPPPSGPVQWVSLKKRKQGSSSHSGSANYFGPPALAVPVKNAERATESPQ